MDSTTNIHRLNILFINNRTQNGTTTGECTNQNNCN